MKKLLPLWYALAAFCAFTALAPGATAQDAEGRVKQGPEGGAVKKGNGVRKGGQPPRSDGGARRTVSRCDPGQVVVRCGMPGCTILLGNAQQGVTDGAGELPVQLPNGTHTLSASKPHHDPAQEQVRVACGETKVVELKPRPRTVAVRIRTSLPECDIYINNSPTSLGKSDAQGIFNYQVLPSQLLVEARKKGYLSQIQRVTVSPAGNMGEITLVLEPIKASLTVSANVADARAAVDGETTRPISEKILLTPGRHRVTVDALGHAPAMFEVAPVPDEKITKTVVLERLPPADLVRQAEKLYEQRAFASVRALCAYVFEADAGNAPAHRLAGLTYLAEQDYTRAEHHLAKALAANETVRLQLRRHPGESFDLNKGHDSCEAALLLNGSEIAFQGARHAAENFKVPYSQIEVSGIQLKKNTAPYLGTKVTVTSGKKKDYNFYSFERELTQTGKPFLEMLQRLLRRRF
jgi:hypothetical protein